MRNVFSDGRLLGSFIRRRHSLRRIAEEKTTDGITKRCRREVPASHAFLIVFPERDINRRAARGSEVASMTVDGIQTLAGVARAVLISVFLIGIRLPGTVVFRITHVVGICILSVLADGRRFFLMRGNGCGHRDGSWNGNRCWDWNAAISGTGEWRLDNVTNSIATGASLAIHEARQRASQAFHFFANVVAAERGSGAIFRAVAFRFLHLANAVAAEHGRKGKVHGRIDYSTRGIDTLRHVFHGNRMHVFIRCGLLHRENDKTQHETQPNANDGFSEEISQSHWGRYYSAAGVFARTPLRGRGCLVLCAIAAAAKPACR